MKSPLASTTVKAVLVSLVVLGMRIPAGQAQALFFGAIPEQVTVYNGVEPAAGQPAAVTTTTSTTTTASAQQVSLAPPVPIVPPDSIDSRLNTANDAAAVRNGARSDN